MPPTHTEAASTCRARKTTSTAKRYAMRAWRLRHHLARAAPRPARHRRPRDLPRRNRGRVARRDDLGHRRHRHGAFRKRRGELLRLGHPQGAQSRHLARQPRGHAGDGRLVEVRAEEHRLLRVPGAAVVLVRAQAGRLHDHEPREQPRPRLRRVGPGRDDRRAQARRPALHGPAGRDRRPAERRDEGRVRRLRAVPVGAETCSTSRMR